MADASEATNEQLASFLDRYAEFFRMSEADGGNFAEIAKRLRAIPEPERGGRDDDWQRGKALYEAARAIAGGVPWYDLSSGSQGLWISSARHPPEEGFVEEVVDQKVLADAHNDLERAKELYDDWRIQGPKWKKLDLDEQDEWVHRAIAEREHTKMWGSS